MTKEAMDAVIGRAATDEAFRLLLLNEPDRALSEYDLSQEEIARLKAIPAGTWVAAGSAPDVALDWQPDGPRPPINPS